VKAGIALGLAILCFLAALLAWSDEASATTTCHATGTWCQGYAHASTTTGGVASARCFAWRTTNTAPTCSLTGITPTNEATWQASPGSCITLYYFDTTTGAVPPLAPNKVTLRLAFDNQALPGGLIHTYLNAGAEPANGSTTSVCATSDGTATGAARSGTYRLLVQAVQDASIAPQNYNIDSDGGATVGTNVGFDKGAFRGQTLVSSITRSAYPSGSTFAYGASSDESVTVTSTFTQPVADGNVETVRNFVLDNAGLTIGQSGATVDTDSTSLAQAFVADSTFPAANSPYVPGMNLIGNSALTGLTWTTYAATGHGSGIVRLSDTAVYDSAPFNINPEIKFDKDGSGSFAGADDLTEPRVGSCGGAVVTVFNKGETVCNSWYMMNARGELLSRAMTFAREDSTGATCNSFGSITPTSNKYTTTSTLSTGTTCNSANDLVGLPRYVRATNTDQNHRSGANYGVSTYLYVDYHPQKTSTLVQDDWPTQDSAEASTFVISADQMFIWCHVRGVRLDVNIDTGVNDVIVKETETDDTTVIDTFTIGTGSNGWTTSSDLVNPVPPSRSIHGHCDVTFNGNTGSVTQSVGWSSAFTGDLNCRLTDADYWPEVGNTTRLYIMVNQEGEPAVPDEAPHISIYYVDDSAYPPVWTPDVVHDEVRNVLDNTTTVNGSLYYYDWTPSVSGLISLETHCQLNGSPLYQDKTLSVLPMSLDIDITGTSFGGMGIDGFLFAVAWFFALVYFLTHAKAFAAIACSVGIFVSIFLGGFGQWTQLTAAFFLAIAIWIEAIGKDKLYRRLFKKQTTDSPKPDVKP